MTSLSVNQAIARFISLIPADHKDTGISQLAAALDGVIAQRLARSRDGKFRPAVEVFRGGVASIGSIQESRLKDLSHFIESRQDGMQSLDQHLLELNQSGVISGTETMRRATNPEAVAVELRAPRQANAGPVPAAPVPGAPYPVGSQPGLQP